MAKAIKRQEIINKLQVVLSENGLQATKKDTAVILSAVEETFAGVLYGTTEGDYDSLRLSFGTFKAVEVPAREGVSALDGKAWKSPAHQTLRFKLGKTFKENMKQATAK